MTTLKPKRPHRAIKHNPEATLDRKVHTGQGELKAKPARMKVKVFTVSDTQKHELDAGARIKAYKKRRKEALEAIRRHRRELVDS